MKRYTKILTLICAAPALLLGGCEKDPAESLELIETTRIKEITYDSAVCVGYVLGNCSEKGIWYAPAEMPAQGQTVAAPEGGAGTFELPIEGLQKGTSYVVCTYAVSNGETHTSARKQFTTLREGEPLLRFTAPSKVSNASVRLEGYVVADGGKAVAERGFCYGKNENPTIENAETVTVGGDIGRLTADITGLDDGETYYGCIYLRNDLGTFYSPAEAFTTIPYNKPVPTVLGIEGLGTAAMTVRARIESDNDLPITGRGIRYSLTEDFADGTDVAASEAALGEYSVTVSGLDPEQLYNVWAYASNRKGTAYSEMLTAKALVRVEAVGSLGRSATGSLTIANLGSFESPVSEAGLCWSTSPNPTVAGEHVKVDVDGQLGLGTYEGLTMRTLKPSTQYYVRAYAVNEYGRSYSREFTFTTRQDLYDAQFRVGSAGGKLPYVNAWQIILNDVTSASAANVPESALSPAFAKIYADLGKACTSYQQSYMNGVIYRLRPTTDGKLLMQFTLYFRKNDAKKTLTFTGWSNIQFERDADGTFRFLQHQPMTSVFYTGNTDEGRAYVDVMFEYFKAHRFYFEWSAPDYEFGTSIDTKTGPIRMVPLDAPDDYWTFTQKNYTAAADIDPIANPF